MENLHKTSGCSDVGVTFGMYYPTGVLWFELFLLVFPECLLLDFVGISSIAVPMGCIGKNILKEISAIYANFSCLIHLGIK